MTKKEGAEDVVFTAWKLRKDSMNPDSAAKSGGLKPPDAQNSRRKSHLKGMVGFKGVADFRRMTLTMRTKSDVSNDNIKPQIQKEPTYKMQPDPGTGFSEFKVKNAVFKLLEDECSGLEYDQDICSKLACILAERVKEKVKTLGFVRHKIAANVIVGQAGDQGIEVTSRCCWNTATDNFACVTYKNKTMNVIALVYGIYYD